MEITKLYIPLPGAVSKAAIQYRVSYEDEWGKL
jgi:hypothetical protein